MYTNKPLVETTEDIVGPNVPNYTRQIEHLEDKVRQLSEQVHKIATALELNSRQIRRQNTDIHNVTTVLRNR